MSEFSLSHEPFLSPDVFDAVVREIGSDGNELLAAVEEDTTVFCQNEQENFPEDQKNFLWNPQQHYDHYNDQQQLMYAPQPANLAPQIPANVDYPGQFDFDILISSHTANRNSWIYSQILNKVFINMSNILPVDVKRNPTDTNLYLRATLLYSLPQFAQDLVERCSTHIDPRMISNRAIFDKGEEIFDGSGNRILATNDENCSLPDIDPMIVKHVLRCPTQDSVYMGNTDRKEHLSVVTPLPQPQAGMDTVRVNYQFMCKNSCPSGMNRRAVDVIFTLEGQCGTVLGRRKLSVRVCSCPKRDKEKEEKEFRESQQSHHPTSQGRKRKLPMSLRMKSESALTPDDNSVYDIPIRVIGRANIEATLRFARDRMISDIHYGKLDEDTAKDLIQKLNNDIKKLSPE